MSRVGYEQVGVAMTCRGFEEYLLMFNLKEKELPKGRVLDVAAGGSSFTAEARSRGYDAYAADPRYSRNAEEWIAEAAGEIIASTAKLEKLRDQFNWDYYGSPEMHHKGRAASLERFKQHARSAEGAACYQEGKLPNLPYEDNSFSLVLCSHFLFLYSEQFGLNFHIESVAELMRVTKPGGEIRIYPLIGLNWEPYAELEQLLSAVHDRGGRTSLQPSNLPFIPGSTHYLQIICFD